MLGEFHDNSEKLEVLRETLKKRYGLKVITPPPSASLGVNPELEELEQFAGQDIDDPENWDCRFKQIAQCQGTSLQGMSASGREMCRE